VFDLLVFLPYFALMTLSLSFLVDSDGGSILSHRPNLKVIFDHKQNGQDIHRVWLGKILGGCFCTVWIQFEL
jgi:hypothetical protein